METCSLNDYNPLKSSQEHNYPHMCLYVCHFCSTNSTFVVFDTSMLFSIMLEQFCQGEEFEMAIRTFVAPLVASVALQWRGLEAVTQFVPFHPPWLWRPKGATRNVTEHPSMLINIRTTLFKMEFNRFRASEKGTKVIVYTSISTPMDFKNPLYTLLLVPQWILKTHLSSEKIRQIATPEGINIVI